MPISLNPRSPDPRRRWNAAALALLVLLALLAAPIFVFSSPVASATTGRDELSAQLSELLVGKRNDLTLRVAKLNKEWLTRLVTSGAAEAVTALRAEFTDLDDEDLMLLAGFPRLQHLVLRGVASRRADWLTACPTLQIVNLPDAPLSDAWLQAAAEAPQLQSVRAGGQGISDRGLARLASSRSLRFLHLFAPPVTLHGLRAIASLPTLESLYLDETPVPEEDMGGLASDFPHLHLHFNQMHADRTPAD